MTTSKSEKESRAYTPGWVDLVIARIDHLTGPSWLYYSVTGLVLFGIQTVAMWIEGAYPVGTFQLIHGVLAWMFVFPLALLHYLNRVAGNALTTLLPLLKANEEKHNQLRYQLTTRPARQTILASLAWLIVGILVTALGAPSSFQVLAGWPISTALLNLIYMTSWWVFGAFIYHTIHQLRLISRILTEYTQINLFQMRPLYAFSRLTALTAIGLTVNPYAWAVVNPEALASAVGGGIYILITVLAIAIFVWPMLGVHQLLGNEKERWLSDCSLHLEGTIVELHQRLDSGELEGMGDLNTAIASLEVEQTALTRIPTWPWQPETVRALATALLVPLGLWAIQFVLQRLLSV